MNMETITDDQIKDIVDELNALDETQEEIEEVDEIDDHEEIVESKAKAYRSKDGETNKEMFDMLKAKAVATKIVEQIYFLLKNQKLTHVKLIIDDPAGIVSVGDALHVINSSTSYEYVGIVVSAQRLKNIVGQSPYVTIRFDDVYKNMIRIQTPDTKTFPSEQIEQEEYKLPKDDYPREINFSDLTLEDEAYDPHDM